MKVIGVGIIGCGKISRKHGDAVKALPQGKLLAVSSRNEERAKSMAMVYDCDYYTDYHEMLKREDIEVVIICTPNNTHSDIGISVAKMGKHLIVEKPIDGSIAKGQALIDTCHEEKVKLTCIFQHRYDGSIKTLKKAIESGQLGRLTSGSCYAKGFRSQAYYDSSPGRGTWAADGGGALLMNGIHTVDALIYLLGPIKEVFAFCTTTIHENIEVEDVAAAIVKFENGLTGVIESSSAAFPGKMVRLEVNGEHGSVIVENDHIKDWRIKDEGMALQDFFGNIMNDEAYRDNGHLYEETSTIPTFVQQIGGFLDAVIKDEAPFVSGESALHSLKVVLAIYRSAREKTLVRIDDLK